MKRTLQFPRLEPDRTSPSDIGFFPSLTKAVLSVYEGEIAVGIWRPLEKQAVVDACSAIQWRSAASKGCDFDIIWEDDVYGAVPSIETFFADAAHELLSIAQPKASICHPYFKAFFKGYRDEMHHDELEHRQDAVELQRLIVLKGQGTWIVSPNDLSAHGLASHEVHAFCSLPTEIIYELSPGDIAVWRKDLLHMGPIIARPDDERLIHVSTIIVTPTAPAP